MKWSHGHSCDRDHCCQGHEDIAHTLRANKINRQLLEQNLMLWEHENVV